MQTIVPHVWSRKMIPLLTVLLVLQIVPSGILIDMGSDATDAGRADTCYVTEDSSEVRIGNDLVELVFSKGTKGGLDRILDKSTGIDLRPDKDVPPISYAIFYDPGTGTDAALQWDAVSVTYETSTSSSGCELYINGSMVKGHDLNTSIYVRIEDGSSLFRMRMDIECGPGIMIKYAFFPLVWGMGPIGPEQDDDYLFYPTGDGVILRDPLRDIDSLYLSDMYPAGVSMQFMCHYDPDEAGLYLATQDTEGYPKKLNMVSLDWAGQRRLSSYFEIYSPEYPGNGLRMDYDALLGIFHGDWYDAADIYSEWAMTTPFVSGGKVGADKGTPEWWLDTSILSAANRDRGIVHNTLPAIVNMTQEMSDLTDLNTTALIFTWEKEGGWVGPNFFPPAEGEEEFISAMEDLAYSGDHGFVYMSGTVWRITRGDIGYSNWSYFNSTGKPWAALKEDGSVHIDENYATIDWQCARMCPITQFWHDMVVQNFLELIRLGVDVVQIDEFPIGTMYPCYNASHGHPVGFSRDMSNALVSILEECRSMGRTMNPDLVISSEEPCELYLPYLDTYVSRDNAEEYMLYPWTKQIYGDRAHFVPAFGYVYHEYITSFGEPLFMGKSYPEVLNEQIERGMARSLVQGEILAGGGAKQSDIWPNLLELYDRAATASATYANEYTVHGKMLRPPVLDVPKEQVEWYFGSIGAFGNPFNESAILNGAWRSPDGDVGHVLVNWIDDPVTFELPIEGYYTGQERVSIIKTTNGLRQLIQGSVGLPMTLELTMEPNDVVLIEILRAPDITPEITYPGPVMTNESIKLNMVFVNGGSVPSSPFDSAIFLDGSEIGSVNVPIITEGSWIPVHFDLNTTGLVGNHILTVVADPGNIVPELFEDNNEATMTLEVLDRPRSTISILVLDISTGEPIEGCNVTLTRTDGIELLVLERSNISGFVRFPSLISGPYRIDLNVSGYNNKRVDIDLPEGIERDLTIVLDPITVLFKISGQVIDNATGAPIEGAILTLSRTDGETSTPIISNTNVSGGFTFVIPSGGYNLTISKEGYENYTAAFIFPGGPDNVTISLKRTSTSMQKGSLKGVVTDVRTGEPVVGALVKIKPISSFVRTYYDGGYQVDDLQPGIYSVNVSAEGYHPTEIEVSIMAGTVTSQDIALVPFEEPVVVLGTITGFVTDRDGGPVQGAVFKDGENRSVATTGSNGSYSIVDLGPGTYSFTVWADGYLPKGTGEIPIDGNTVTLDIVLDPIELPDHIDPGEDDDISPILIAIVLIVILVAIVSIVAYFLSRRGSNPERWEE